MKQIEEYIIDVKEVGLNYCLCNTFYADLDALIARCSNEYLKKYKNTKLTDDDHLRYYLRYMLLKVSTHHIWQEQSVKSNLNTDYLIMAIRKNLFLTKPTLDFEN